MEWRPLDILFTKSARGLGKIVDIGQKIHFGVSYGCHMHIIVNKDILGNVCGLEEGRWYLLESNLPYNDAIDPLDVVSGKYKDGVQIRDLEDVVAYNKSIGNKVFLSRLITNPWDCLNKRTFVAAEMAKVIERYYKCAYQHGATQMGASIFDTLIPISQSKAEDKVYCSQLISIIYRRLGVLRKFGNSRDHVAPQQLLGNKELLSSPVEI